MDEYLTPQLIKTSPPNSLKSILVQLSKKWFIGIINLSHSFPWRENFNFSQEVYSVHLIYLDSWGLVVPALNRVGEAWVNHFSESRLYVSTAASMSPLWIPTATLISMCWGLSATMESGEQ